MGSELLDIIKKRTFYLKAAEIAEICRPLFTTFAFNLFYYSKIHADNSCVVLTSDRDSFYHYVKTKSPMHGTIVTSGVHLWNDFLPQSVLNDQAAYFNYHNGIIVVTNTEPYVEYFGLAAPAENHSVLDFYFNNLGLLDQFLFYFKDQAAKIIDRAHKDRFIIPGEMRGAPLENKSYGEFCKQIQTKRIRMNFHSQQVIFSRREYECLVHLAKGKAIKAIARILNISPRTVETHLINIKRKTNYISRAALVDTFLDNLIAFSVV